MSILSGNIHENSGFVFDKIYPNYKSLNTNDGIYPLRYVLIKYCDTAFTQSEQEGIKQTGGTTEQEQEWYKNYVEDKGISYDRKIFRKEVKEDNTLEYKEFATLNVGATIEGYQEKDLNLNNGTGAYSLQAPTAQAQGNFSTALGLSGQAHSTHSFAVGGGAVAGNPALEEDATMSAMALGNSVQATGKYSFASGLGTVASDDASTAMGWKTNSSGWGSFTTGLFTRAIGNGQTVIGRNNTNSGALFVVGNGEYSPLGEPSNAFEVFPDGHAELQTSSDNDNAVLRRKDLSDFVKVISEQDVEFKEDGSILLPEEAGNPQIVILY